MGYCNLFARLLVYQVIFVGIYHGLTNTTKSANEFKDKYYSLERWVKQKTDFSLLSLPFHEDLLSNKPVLFYRLYLGKIAFFGLLGLLGFKVGAWGSALLVVFKVFLFMNPFLPENKIHYPYSINMDLLLNIGFILALLMTTTNFCQSACDGNAQVYEKIKSFDNKTEERSHAPSSGGQGSRKKKQM